MIIFEKVSPENTPVSIKLAIEKAKEISTDIVLATTTGASVFAVLELAAEMEYKGRIIAITHVWGRKPGENELSEENRKKLTEAGVILVTAGHALSGVERSFTNQLGGVYPVEIMAHTFRLFSEGMKVCVEIGAMALDAGAIKEPRAVVALGGTGSCYNTGNISAYSYVNDSDTSGYSAKIFDTRIHEILCMPY